jgi:hypothetical protein
MNINIGYAYSVVNDNLQFHKVCARRVSKELKDEHKGMCLDICSRHLDIIAKRVATSCSRPSQVMKPGFTTVNQKPNRRACKWSISHLLLQRSSGWNDWQANLRWSSFGMLKGLFLRPACNVECLSHVQLIVICLREIWRLQWTLKEEDRQRVSCCCTTMPILILQPACWKPSGNWSGESWHIQPAVQIRRHLDPLKKL